MEEERKGKPVAALGGMYAKAKQRVLNSIGKRTTLTKNPRVDFISRRVEEIKAKKTDVSSLATTAATQLAALRSTVTALDRAMLDAYRDELGDRRWDDSSTSYVRVLHPEEKRLVADMERALARSTQVMDKVLAGYTGHLEEVAEKPLTFHTPEEDAHLATVMQTKEEYKLIRTVYSDAMIDADAHLATGADPSPSLQQKVDDAKHQYEQMSERLCDDALKYEHIFREELSQRVAAHFTAEQHLLRGVSAAMRDFYPYTRGLTLDWQDMRAARKTALAAAKSNSDDPAMAHHVDGSLPPPPSSPFAPQPLASTGNPFGDDDDGSEPAPQLGSSASSGSSNLRVDQATKVVSSASAAAATAATNAGNAIRHKSKGLTSMLASYGPGGRSGSSAGTSITSAAAVHSAKRSVNGDDGWDNIKL
jgi:hypothetical protein